MTQKRSGKSGARKGPASARKTPAKSSRSTGSKARRKAPAKAGRRPTSQRSRRKKAAGLSLVRRLAGRWVPAGLIGLGALSLALLLWTHLERPDETVQQAGTPVESAQEVATSASAPPVQPARQETEQRKKQTAAAAPPPPPKRQQKAVSRPDDPPWKRFAAPYKAAAGAPRIAVVIDDLGLNAERSRQVMRLPAPLTLAFLPYGPRAASLAQEARAKGHEVLIHMPMEASTGADAGENALHRNLGAAENLRRLNWALARLEGYVGINNHMGSAFTADAAALEPIVTALRDRGLLALDSRTSAASRFAAQAAGKGVPVARRDLFLDHVSQDAGGVLAVLREAEELAAATGEAIVIGHPYPGTLTALSLWIPDATARGFALVPISALVRQTAVPRG